MLSQNVQVALTVAGVIAGVGGSVFYLLPHLKKIGVNVENILVKIEAALNGADNVIKTAEAIIPDKKVDGVLTEVDKIIENWVLKGCKAAEQMYISSQLKPEERKTYAIDTVKAALNLAGIPVTDNIATLIDAAIDSFVNDSKTNDEKNSQEVKMLNTTIATLQKQVSEAQTTVSALNTDNTTLKQKLAAVQTTVASSNAKDTVVNQSGATVQAQ